jgi:hypothetical protein
VTQYSISIDRVTTTFTQILGWMLSSRDLTFAGAKCASLATLLDPTSSGYRNLSEVARAANCSRATLSKALMCLRDDFGVELTAGKLGSSREAYHRAQLAAVQRGTHASNVVRKNTLSGH